MFLFSSTFLSETPDLHPWAVCELNFNIFVKICFVKILADEWKLKKRSKRKILRNTNKYWVWKQLFGWFKIAQLASDIFCVLSLALQSNLTFYSLNCIRQLLFTFNATWTQLFFLPQTEEEEKTLILNSSQLYLFSYLYKFKSFKPPK